MTAKAKAANKPKATEARIEKHNRQWLADDQERAILATLVNDPEVIEEYEGLLDCNKITPGHCSIREAYRLAKFSFAMEQAFQALREKAGLGKCD